MGDEAAAAACSMRVQDFAGSWHVLFFYPLDFTFVCPTEIIAFSDRVKEFDAIGAKVAAVSVDSKFSHLAWTQLPRSKGSWLLIVVVASAFVGPGFQRQPGSPRHPCMQVAWERWPYR